MNRAQEVFLFAIGYLYLMTPIFQQKAGEWEQTVKVWLLQDKYFALLRFQEIN